MITSWKDVRIPLKIDWGKTKMGQGMDDGQNAWDNIDYSHNFVWLGFDRSIYKMGQVTIDNVEDVFNYQTPEADQLEAFVKVRTALTAAAKVILENVPECADRTVAIRKLREARMDANSAIALRGKI